MVSEVSVDSGETSTIWLPSRFNVEGGASQQLVDEEEPEEPEEAVIRDPNTFWSHTPLKVNGI